MTDIDGEVADFARQLDAGVFDVAQIAADSQTLIAELVNATTDELAAVALREFIDARPDDVAYARAVALGALTQLGQYVVLFHDLSDFDGPQGILARLKRLAYAARGLGLAGFAARTMGGI